MLSFYNGEFSMNDKERRKRVREISDNEVNNPEWRKEHMIEEEEQVGRDVRPCFGQYPEGSIECTDDCDDRKDCKAATAKLPKAEEPEPPQMSEKLIFRGTFELIGDVQFLGNLKMHPGSSIECVLVEEEKPPKEKEAAAEGAEQE